MSNTPQHMLGPSLTFVAVHLSTVPILILFSAHVQTVRGLTYATRLYPYLFCAVFKVRPFYFNIWRPQESSFVLFEDKSKFENQANGR